MRYLALLLIAALAGCATRPPPAMPLPVTPWEQRQQQLAPQQHWTLQGKIAVRVNGTNNAANLNWTQHGDAYRIFMAGPLGRGAVDIEGTSQRLRLLIAGEEPYETDNPEMLLYQRLGWSFPLDQVNWWIRGLPAPASPHRIVLDERQRLSELNQSGWTIRYPRYREFNGTELPAKLILTRGDQLKLTLVFKSWQLGTGES
ncbi:lipoprotein insertase outer membrane protein LolB [Motiliproteus sediminis]|uniref:lipoprotein insertase outer membrane protein LolB n=1 Tax=Motiliproteus sediminis TaxID=1468178 RepID=UPI001AEF3B71|nr:lipoprotein insertase outer membrane protein LolB [Motiliproteus sediminis]